MLILEIEWMKWRRIIDSLDYENSQLYFEKVLKIEPNFLWVKNELYPEFLNKMMMRI